jgi:cell division protein FtsI/penicillin-binding protein 2
MENYSVAGKTGTAQKPENGGYSDTKFYSSFIGFFPASDPEVLIAIIVDEPEYDPVHKTHQGGRAAAPVFRQVGTNVANYLNIRPDIIGTNAATASALVSGNP